jgi:hypothetical protein
MIKGIKIQLVVKEVSGKDAIGNPVFTEDLVDVDNILIEPTGDQEILDTVNLHGREAKYTLHIPKGDVHEWEDTEVVFYGERWRTIGKGRDWMAENTPGPWNKKVLVESKTETEDNV